MTDLKGTLANIARAIVDNPDEVTVIAAEETENSVTLKLSVAPSDMGKVIGKHGKNARSIRAVMKAAAAADGKKSVVDIAE